MPEKRINEIFPQLPSTISLVIYEEMPSQIMEVIIAKNARIYNPNSDIWLQHFSIPKELRNGSDGTHYGTLIIQGLVEKYRHKYNKICFYFDPKEGEDREAVKRFYENHFGFVFTDEIPGYTFGYLNI